MHAYVCDYITDLVQNAIEAGAGQITLEIATAPETIRIAIGDNGKGMSPETLKKAMNPFYSEAGKHDHRRVGLGLPLLRQAADALEGSLDVQSEPGKGTRVAFTFNARHLDMPPMGDIPATVVGLMAFPGSFDLTLQRQTPHGSYEISRSEIIETLGSLGDPSNLALTKAFLREQEEGIRQGA